MLIALTRTPPPTLVNCELTFVPRAPINFARALQQHAAYCAALAQCGAHVESLPAAPDLPDSVFVEDAVIVVDEIAVITGLGTPSRQREAHLMAPTVGRYRPLVRIEPPATIEGGDVLRVGRTLYVGLSPRTNAAGVEALQRAVAPFAYHVIGVPISGCLHLKTGCTSLDDQTLLVNPAWIELAPFAGYRILQAAPDEPWAANVLRIGTTLLMNAASPRTISLVEQQGYTVCALDISEFMKAEAGLTCMSVVIRQKDH